MSVMVSLVLVLIAAAGVAAAVMVALMARGLLRPPRMTDGKAAWVLKRLSPADLQLNYQSTTFVVRDREGRQLPIAAWWIPHAQSNGRCVLLIHGYADAKVGALAWAPVFHELGWNILAIDLRAHGESGGRYCSAGFWEREDVGQVIEQFRAQWPAAAQKLVLFGASLGATVASAVAARREDIDGIILDSPARDFEDASRRHMRLLGLPGWPLSDLAVRTAQWWSEADFSQIAPVRTIGQVRCGILIIVGEMDPIVTAEDVRDLERAVQGRPLGANPGKALVVKEAGHLMALAADPQGYRLAVAEFLQKL